VEAHTAFTLWLLIVGALFLVMALTGTTLKRLPLTTALIYRTHSEYSIAVC
jgi:hypothetical protein